VLNLRVTKEFWEVEMKVMKFGGGCLRDEKDFLTISQIVKPEKERLIIVVSAIYGLTDLLIEAMKRALISEREIDEIVEKIKNVHFEICEKGIIKNEIKVVVRKEIGSRIEKLRRNLYGICYTSEITDSVRARILSYGERFSAFLLAGFLKNEGIPAEAFESDKIGIVTDESYDNASANLLEAEKNLTSNLLPVLRRGIVSVITGYFGCTPSGRVSLFGRNGSDYSASVIAYALDASVLLIWKDVDGFMSADPKIVKNAKPLKRLSYSEAAELSYFGAKILHPRTVEPIAMKKVPLVIKNMKEPQKNGTLITHERNEAENIIKSVTCNRQISILRIQGAGVGYKPGIISEIGKRLSEKDINIYSIITSQTCINLIIDRNDSRESWRCLNSLEGGVIEKIEEMKNIALVAVVGEGILKKEGIAARVFSAVATEGVNIEMMSGGASDVAYYFIIKEEYLEKVITAIHSEFFGKLKD